MFNGFILSFFVSCKTDLYPADSTDICSKNTSFSTWTVILFIPTSLNIFVTYNRKERKKESLFRNMKLGVPQFVSEINRSFIFQTFEINRSANVPKPKQRVEF